MRLMLPLLVLLTFALPAAAKETVPPEVARAVQAIILDAWPEDDPDCAECNLPRPPETPDAATINKWLKDGALKPVNLSPATPSDWLINTEFLDRPAYWCGTGGCEIVIYSPSGDGHYSKVFDGQIRMFKFRPIAGKDYRWMEVDYHGTMCGSFGVDACPWGYEWKDGGLSYSLRFIKGEILRTLPLPTTDESRVAEPAVVTQLVDTQKAACAARGAAFSEYSRASRVPDLNGDGIDEWLFSGALSYCTYPEPPEGTEAVEHDDPCGFLECGERLWLSAAGGDWREADWNPADIHAIVLSQDKPARVVVLSSPPGMAPDDAAACDTYTLANCVKTPISLSPKP